VRRRILLLVVGMTTIVVLAFAIPLAIFVRHNAYDNGVTALGNEARDIANYLRAVNSTRTESEIAAYLKRLNSGRSASVQLSESDGSKIIGKLPPGGTDNLPALQARFGQRAASGATASPTPAPDGGGGGGGGGGTDPGVFGRDLKPETYAGGKLVQLYVPTFTGFGQSTSGQSATGQPSASGQPGAAQFYTVRVWAGDGQLHTGQTGPLLLIVGVAVALLLVGVVAGEVLTRRIVRPLVDTADTAQRLGSGDTSARAPTTGPREVADVGLALNRLADRIDELIAEERETVADLSHRLRTPLTALRLDAEALRDQTDSERIGLHVGTLERMLTAVIRAARRPQREGRIPSCDATAVVGERVGFWSALAEDQERATAVSLPEDALLVRAGAEDLAAAVDALVENVIAHTPEGTPFAVTLTATDAGAHLVVSDDGPGLPPDAPVRGRSDRGSSGLGLDIARRCAEAAGGAMTIGSSPAGGALVALELRRP